MGCGNGGVGLSEKDENIKENVKEFYNNAILFDIIMNYITFHQNIFRKNDNQKKYLVETDFFQKLLEILSIDLKKKEFDFIELKKMFDLKGPIPKIYKFNIISKKDLIKYNNSAIEILNDEILNHLGIKEKEYKDKEIIYEISSDKKIEILLEEKTSKFIIEENNKGFLTIKLEKQNSLHYDENKLFNNSSIHDSMRSKKTNADDNSNNQNMKKDNHKNFEPNLKEIKENYQQKQSEDVINQDIFTENIHLPNYNLDSLSMESDLQFTRVGLIQINNSIVVDRNNEIQSKYEFYSINYKNFFEELDNIDALLSKPIDIYTNCNEYVIISKRYYNKLIKLFESKENFDNESYIIDSFDKLTKIDNIDININIFKERIKLYIKKYHLFELDVEKIKNHHKLKYPKKFTLIKKECLLNFGLKKDIIKINTFKLLFGENYLFIKTKNSIIVCSKDNIFFDVNFIFLCSNKYYLETEIVPNIQNKGGFYDFFNKIGFHNTNEDSIFKYNNNEIIIIKYKEDIKKEYIKQIILSLSYIEILRKELAIYSDEGKEIISLFLEFIRNRNQDMNIINEIFLQIINLKTKEDLNNFRIMIEIILDKMHQRLNSKQKTNDDYPKESNDRNYIYKVFKNNFDNQNDSLIKNIFFGIILNTTIPKCNCKEKVYSCESSKYIYLNFDNIKTYDNLEDILQNWRKPLKNFYCKNCGIECGEADLTKQLIEYPQILIIILNDANGESKKSIKLPVILDVPKFSFKYKLINVISSKNKDNNFNIINQNNNIWTLYYNVSKEEIERKDIKKWVKYPRVIFYEKDEEKKDYEESMTKKVFENYFEKSRTEKSLLMNTRMKNSLRYLNDFSEDEEKDMELFKMKSNPYNNDINLKLKNDLKPSIINFQNDLNKNHPNNNTNNQKENNNALHDILNNNNTKIQKQENKYSRKNMNNLNNPTENSLNNETEKNLINFNSNSINRNMNNFIKMNNYNMPIINNNLNISSNIINNNFNAMGIGSNNDNEVHSIDDFVFDYNRRENNDENIDDKNMINLIRKNIINNFNNSGFIGNFKIYYVNFNNPNHSNSNENGLSLGQNNFHRENSLNPVLNKFDIEINNHLIQNNFNNNNNLKPNNNVKIEIEFHFEAGRKCSVSMNDDNIPFGAVVTKLIQKYPWINKKDLSKLYFIYNGWKIDNFNKTVREYDMKDKTIIEIRFEENE